MEGMSVLGGAAIVGVIGLLVGLWSHIKGFFQTISSVVVFRLDLDGSAAYAAACYLTHCCRRIQIGEILAIGRNEYVRSEMRNRMILFKAVPKKGSLWLCGKAILWVRRDWSTLHINFIRYTLNCDKFLLDVENYFNSLDNRGSRFFVVRKQGSVGEKLSAVMTMKKKDDNEGGCDWDVKVDRYSAKAIGTDFDDIGQPVRENSIEDLALNEEALKAHDDIQAWRKHESWYKGCGLPWKLGWLLVGIPGTGKTAFVRATGQAMDMPIFIFDVASMTNKDFVEAWEDAMNWSPCIVLIEDIHETYEGGKRIADIGEEAGLTFDCLLNVIDGVENTDGIIVVITTNDIKKVDSALGGKYNGTGTTRPGRVDRVIGFDMLTVEGKEKIARRILGDFPREQWNHLVSGTNGVTGAQFQDACRLKAMEFLTEKVM